MRKDDWTREEARSSVPDGMVSKEGKGKFIIGFDGRSFAHSAQSTRSKVVRHPRLAVQKILLDSRCSIVFSRPVGIQSRLSTDSV
jgi:hypothetical protein